MSAQWYDEDERPAPAAKAPWKPQRPDRRAELAEFVQKAAPPPGKGTVWPHLVAAARALVPLVEMVDAYEDEFSCEVPDSSYKGEYELARQLADQTLTIYTMLAECARFRAENFVDDARARARGRAVTIPATELLSTNLGPNK